MLKDLFFAARYATFYRLEMWAEGTRFLVKPKTSEEKAYLEQMNNALERLWRKPEKARQIALPKVAQFDDAVSEMILDIPKNLTTAVPTVLIGHDNCIVDYQHAGWMTRQAFRLASLAEKAGVALPYSTEGFILCYESKYFMALDWTRAQIYAQDKMDAEVKIRQTVVLAEMLMLMIDYRGAMSHTKPANADLWKFMQQAANGSFLSATEASRILEGFLI